MRDNKSLNKKKQRKKPGIAWRIFYRIVIVSMLYLIFVSFLKLCNIYMDYHRANVEYDDLRSEYVRSGTETEADLTVTPGTMEERESDEGSEEAERDKEGYVDGGDHDTDVSEPKPLSIDFAALKDVNADITGWLYVPAVPTISYPVCRGNDNEYYLDHSFKKQQVFAGSIFMDCACEGDFSGRVTILYGHNMRNGSMFGSLKKLDSELAVTDPLIYVMTPHGALKYEIFAVSRVGADSDVYSTSFADDESFMKWGKLLTDPSRIKSERTLKADDRVLLLSTCTSNENVRLVVAAVEVDRIY